MSIQAEFSNYCRACYGKRELSSDQLKEIEQAFLTGAICGIGAMGQLLVKDESDASMARQLEEMVGKVQLRLSAMGCFS